MLQRECEYWMGEELLENNDEIIKGL
ncbi:MAG: hypothetical protein EZS28_046748, partial [Streblomastix strix]